MIEHDGLECDLPPLFLLVGLYRFPTHHLFAFVLFTPGIEVAGKVQLLTPRDHFLTES